jgi:S-adenosylmethionine:tRNA ribosyltransferase-isomerase
MTSFDARELDYELPESSIAQAPLGERDAARLLCVPAEGDFEHRNVRDLPELLRPSLIVLNDTRVIPARLLGHKPSGGRVELLLVERISSIAASERWRALGRASKGLRAGERIALGDGTLTAHVLAPQAPTGMLEVELLTTVGGSATDAVERLGAMPLPPYIKRAAEAQDASRYQTVYAAQPGAVAAPTAGLHFTQALLDALCARGHELAYVTLHVGPGTFAPLRSDDLREHVMHQERFAIPEATCDAVARARREGKSVLAIGTTVMRALESAADDEGRLGAGDGATSIFIYPPYRFRVVDALLTNFHLPRSTLLALVMAFGGVARIRAAYQSAIDSGYRFYSYGDAMLIGGQSVAGGQGSSSAATQASR